MVGRVYTSAGLSRKDLRTQCVIMCTQHKVHTSTQLTIVQEEVIAVSPSVAAEEGRFTASPDGTMSSTPLAVFSIRASA